MPQAASARTKLLAQLRGKTKVHGRADGRCTELDAVVLQCEHDGVRLVAESEESSQELVTVQRDLDAIRIDVSDDSRCKALQLLIKRKQAALGDGANVAQARACTQ